MDKSTLQPAINMSKEAAKEILIEFKQYLGISNKRFNEKDLEKINDFCYNQLTNCEDEELENKLYLIWLFYSFANDYKSFSIDKFLKEKNDLFNVTNYYMFYMEFSDIYSYFSKREFNMDDVYSGYVSVDETDMKKMIKEFENFFDNGVKFIEIISDYNDSPYGWEVRLLADFNKIEPENIIHKLTDDDSTYWYSGLMELDMDDVSDYLSYECQLNFNPLTKNEAKKLLTENKPLPNLRKKFVSIIDGYGSDGWDYKNGCEIDFETIPHKVFKKLEKFGLKEK